MATSIIIIELISSTEIIVSCSRCKGTGRVCPGDSDSEECVSCGGAGCQPVAGNMKIIT